MFKYAVLLVTLVVAVQYSFWGNYLPRGVSAAPARHRESFAMSFGARTIAPFMALLTANLATVMPGATPTLKLAHSMALVAVIATVIALFASRWLPEPGADYRRIEHVCRQTLSTRQCRRESGARMDILARLFDSTTRRVLDGVGVAAGWRCLEIGGGGGSVARWLAERVGARGHVLCTDLDTRIIEQGRAAAPANLEVMRHDIANDPLPTGAFDLIHARLVFLHVIERERALQSVVEALKPGAGW